MTPFVVIFNSGVFYHGRCGTIWSVKTDIREVPVSTLAYIGDAVIELYYRLRYLEDLKTSKLAEKVRKRVSRSGQAGLLDSIWNDLSEEEKEIVKRGMNSRSATRYGNDPDYRKSTGIEALIGYLYLNNRIERIDSILSRGDER